MRFAALLTAFAALPHLASALSQLPNPLRQISHASDVSIEKLQRAPLLHHSSPAFSSYRQVQSWRRSDDGNDAAATDLETEELGVRHDDSFVLTLRAFDQIFKLHMEPNDDLIHPDGLLVHSSSDGEPKHVPRSAVRAYRGHVVHFEHSQRRKREDESRLQRRGDIPTSLWLEEGVMGWASILLHEDGLGKKGVQPSFEGTFGWAGNYHTIQTSDTYSRLKDTQDPPLFHDAEKRSEHRPLIVHRRSDIMADDELHSRADITNAPTATGCGADALDFNLGFDPHPEDFWSADGASLRRRGANSLGGALRPEALMRRSMMPETTLLEPTLFSRQAHSPSYDYDAWQHDLWKRQATGNDVSGQGSNATYTSSIGNTAGCPNEARVVYLGVASDCAYTALFANDSAVRTTILNNMNTVSNIYRSTFNISLGVTELNIQPSTCPSSAPSDIPWNRGCSDSDTLDQRLSDFSRWRGQQGGNGNGLWHLMTGCRATANREIGVAWLGTLCQTSANNQGSQTTSGTGVSSATTRDWEVMAHEIGHNFGAVHDCTSGCVLSGSAAIQNGQAVCCPLSTSSCNAGGDFIMNPVSSQSAGTFSPCTIGNVCSLIGRGLGGQCIVQPGQRTTLSNQQCGNGILEPGEECDAGPNGSQCCTSQCKLTSGSRCDPQASACCTDQCQFASNTTVCRPSVDSRCDQAETCTGTSADCPADVTTSDGTGCGNGLSCASGICTSKDQQCQQAGASLGLSQACPQNSGSCSVTCLSPGSSNSCVRLQQNWIDGTSCSTGRCENGQCVAGTGIDQFSNLYRQNLNIAIPVTIVVGLIVLLLLGCLIRCLCCRRKRPKNRNGGAVTTATSTSFRRRRNGRNQVPTGALPPPPPMMSQRGMPPPPPPAAGGGPPYPPPGGAPYGNGGGYETYGGGWNGADNGNGGRRGDRNSVPPPIPPRQTRTASGRGWVDTSAYNGY